MCLCQQNGFALLALVLALGPAMAAAKQVSPGREEAEKLDVQHQQAEARAGKLRARDVQVRADIADLQHQLVALAARRSAWQQQMGDTEDQLAALEDKERGIVRQLEVGRAHLMDFLAALERAGMIHPPAMAVSPDDANEAARAAILLSDATPQLRTRADRLAATLQALKTVREDKHQQKARLQVQQKTLDESTLNLQALLDKRRVLEKKIHQNAEEAARQANIFASRASTLRELIAQLEAAARGATPRLKPPRAIPRPTATPEYPSRKPKPGKLAPLTPFIAPTGRFSDARGLLRLPVRGTLAGTFGRSRDALRRSGMVIRARRGAQVTAPFDGRILYAGPFRDMGRLLILNVGEGYHIILAGLGRFYVVPDQLVLAGEPVGEMVNRSKLVPELYLELQKDGRSIDPAPWLVGAQGGG